MAPGYLRTKRAPKCHRCHLTTFTLDDKWTCDRCRREIDRHLSITPWGRHGELTPLAAKHEI